MALTAQQKLQAFRSRASGGAGRLSAQDKLRRFRTSTAKPEEEDEDGPSTPIGDFWDRLYYGEEEGEGGAMGLEEVPGQFAEVALSPIEKGLKPLVSLGAGAAKLAVGSDEDEDTELARMAGKQLYESVADLPEDIVRGYPAEGIMNVAAVPTMFLTGGASALGAASKLPKMGTLAKASERLAGMANKPVMRGIAAAADPLTAGIEGVKLAGKAAPAVGARLRELGAPAIAAAAMERIVDPAKDIARAAKEKVTGRPKSAAGEIKKLSEEMAPPGQTKRSIVADYIQGFLTSIPNNAVKEMYKHVGDPQKYKTMLAAANKPKEALKAVHERLKASIKQKATRGTTEYGTARYKFFHGKPKTKGAAPNRQEAVSTDLRENATLPFRINNVLNEALSDGAQGFGARVVVKFYDEAKDGRRIYEGLDEAGEGAQTVRELNSETVGALRTLPNQKYEFDVEFESPTGAQSPLSAAERRAVRDHVRKNLLPSDYNDNPALPIEDLLNKDITFMESNPLKERDMRVNDVLVLRLHKATTGAVEQHLRDVGKAADADAFRNIRKAYENHKSDLAQTRATYGDDIEQGIVTEASGGRLRKAMETAEGVKELEGLVSSKGIQQLLGAMSQAEFGGGLVVKADVSKRLAAAGTIFTGGLLTGGGLGAAMVGVAGLPLLAMYSPRAMLPVSKLIAKSPRFMKMLGRGPKAQKEARRQAQAIMKMARKAREVIGNETIQEFAKQGMTFGQFMERLQEEEQGRR